MKFRQLLFSIVLFLAIGIPSHAQDDSTIILVVRHAEKELTGSDPALSPIGLDRASKLAAAFPAIKPDHFYTTPYVRTGQTVSPWAKQLSMEVKEYDPRQLREFAEMLKAMKGKTIVVAGHSNTNPSLVNLLAGEMKFAALPDTDYQTVYVVTIKNGQSMVKQAVW